MKSAVHWHAGDLLILLLFATVGGAGERSNRDSPLDVYDLYARLSPGMAISTVRSLAAHAGRSALGEAVTSWLLSRHEGPDRGTEVLRASLRDGRLDGAHGVERDPAALATHDPGRSGRGQLS
jgi:hypothetical protein